MRIAVTGLLTGLLAASLGAAELQDARLVPHSSGWRLTGRLDAGAGRLIEVDVDYASDWQVPDLPEHPPPSGRPPPSARPSSIPGPGWLTGPQGHAPMDGRAPPIDLRPPVMGAMDPSLIPGRKVRPPPSAEPWVVALASGEQALLENAFDSRVVAQRRLPEFLSTPFELRLRRGGAVWTFRYDSGLSSDLVSDAVEDGVSRPVLAAWQARDAKAFRATSFARAISAFLDRDHVLTRRRELKIAEVRADLGKGERTLREVRPRLYHLRGEPGPTRLRLRMTVTEHRARLDRVVTVRDRPAEGAVVEVESVAGGSELDAASADAAGWASTRFDPRRPAAIVVITRPAPGSRDTLDLRLAWRWGRAEEAWLDSGRPRFPRAPATARKDMDRLRTMAASLLHAWSPDDERFHDGRSTGLPRRLLATVLVPAQAALGGELPEVAGRERARERVQEALLRISEEGGGLRGYEAPEPDLAPPSNPSLEWVGEALDNAEGEVSSLGKDHWSVRSAAAASKIAHWLAHLPAGVDAGTHRRAEGLLEELARRSRAEPWPHRRGSMTKAGPEPPEPEHRQGWMGHLLLAHAMAASGRAQLAKVQLQALRRHFPSASELTPIRLGLVARYLQALVEEHGFRELATKRDLFRARAWYRYVKQSETLQLSERLGLMQAFVDL